MWNFKTNRLHRQTLYAALILALLLVGMIVALPRTEAKRPDVVLYSSDFKMPVNRGTLFDRIVPLNWVWAWKLREKVRGKVKAVMIEGMCVETRATVEVTIRGLDLSAPTIERDGTRIWLLSMDQSKRMRSKLRKMQGAAVLDTARITTGENSEADLFSGNSFMGPNGPIQAGFSLDASPRIQGEKIDLTSVFTYSETVTNTAAPQGPAPAPSIPIRTNAFFATRIQFSTNSAVLIIAPDESGATNRSIALILTAERR